MTNILSVAFFIFLAAACMVYYCLPRIMRNAWLLCCSYLFYLYEPSNAVFLGVLLSVTGITYLSGLLLERIDSRKGCTLLIALCSIFCIGLFLWFKNTQIAQMICVLLGQLGISSSPSAAVPLGISYFLFMALGYLIDVARGKRLAERNLIHYALFVSFFPLMTAGPIERADQFFPQLQAPAQFRYRQFTGGLFRILWGFFKKMVVADTLGGIVQQVYINLHSTAYTGPVLLIATLLFPLQLYYDFSACTDIAIGAGQLFGIELTENFRRPFAACTFSDLWRRWHMSLTKWLREYIYIPLGGNRHGTVRTILNQAATFSLSGLWHGIAPAYLIWGLLNGIYLSIGKLTARRRKQLLRRSPLFSMPAVHTFIAICINYLLFTSCAVFFITGLYSPASQSVSDALYVYERIFTGWSFTSDTSHILSVLSSIGFTANHVFALLCGITLIESMEYFEIPMHLLIQKIPFFLRWPFYYALCFMILFFGAFGKSSFIYQSY